MLVWIAIAIAGVGMMFIASRNAVHHASLLASSLSIPPFLIGVTLISIGTDIPEIANSLISSLAGHGDLTVGDSVGSTMTQITLVFGLLPFFVGDFKIHRKRTLLIGSFTAVSLAIGAFFVSDGYLSRLEAAFLVSSWGLFTFLAWWFTPPAEEPVLPTGSKEKLFHAILVIFFLILVGVGAGAFVKSMIELSALAGVPEYLISFFGASLGTSLPELVVDVTAIRIGKRDFAVGDIVGSCLVDSTLALGFGPLVAPIAVTAHLAVRGALVAMVAVAAAIAITTIRRRNDYWSGFVLLFLYASAYVFVIAE